MGTLRFGPVAELVRNLKGQFNLTTLVEGGTYQGESTSFAAEHFDRVVTIDIREDFQNQGKARCKDFDNITYLVGDTRNVLPHVIEALAGPAIFWLDSHSVKGLFGAFDDCPILEELEMLNQSRFKHFILIDDAHCFKPPVPHDAAVWPEIQEIVAVAERGGYIVGEAHDVIAIVPPEAFAELSIFLTTEAETNPASAVVAFRKGLERLQKKLAPKIGCVAFALQGGSPGAAVNAPVALDITEMIRTHYGTMLCPRHDTNQTPPLRSGYALDHYNLDILTDLMKDKPRRVFLDIGANVGTFSFALREQFEAVHAFEAQRIIANMVCGSIALNGWDNVFCHNVAVSDAIGKIPAPKFDYSKPLSFGSVEFGPVQKENLLQERQESTESVNTITIDSMLFTNVDLVKIDVEGFEEKVLRGAEQTLRYNRPVIFIEHSKSLSFALRDILLDFGYEIQDCGSDFLCFPKKD